MYMKHITHLDEQDNTLSDSALVERMHELIYYLYVDNCTDAITAVPMHFLSDKRQKQDTI